MSIKKCCSLCFNFCTEYEFLLNEVGECNKLYEITVKYFDPMLLTEEEHVNSDDIQILCLSCWYHISDFHDFQQTVLKARSLWKNKKQLSSLSFVAKGEVRQAEEVAGVLNTKSNEHENNYGEEADTNFKEELLTRFEDDRELIESPTGQVLVNAEIEGSSKHNVNSNKSIKKKKEYGDRDPNDNANVSASALHAKCLERNEKEMISEDICEVESSYDKELFKNFENNQKMIETPLEEQLMEVKNESVIEKSLKSKHACILDQSSKKEHNSEVENITNLNNKRKRRRRSKGNIDSGRAPLARAKDSNAFIAKWKPELCCEVCGERISDYDKLRNHFKENHKTRFYTTCCERKFYRRCVLVNHIRLHINPETHKCDICGRSCSTKDILKHHMKVVHEITKELKCEFCEKLFKENRTLERHLLTHNTPSEYFVCSECGNRYVAEPLLKLHIKRAHSGYRVCDKCGKTVNGAQALQIHLLEHSGVKVCRFRCDICGLELRSNMGLKKHKASRHNDGTTIYVCADCKKVFATEVGLKRHKKLVHVDERKHKCAICQKAFKQPKSLREHIATHTGQDLYQCPHCPQTFKVSSNMYQHRKKAHPVEYEEICKNRVQHATVNIDKVKKQVVL